MNYLWQIQIGKNTEKNEPQKKAQNSKFENLAGSVLL